MCNCTEVTRVNYDANPIMDWGMQNVKRAAQWAIPRAWARGEQVPQQFVQLAFGNDVASAIYDDGTDCYCGSQVQQTQPQQLQQPVQQIFIINKGGKKQQTESIPQSRYYLEPPYQQEIPFVLQPKSGQQIIYIPQQTATKPVNQDNIQANEIKELLKVIKALTDAINGKGNATAEAAKTAENNDVKELVKVVKALTDAIKGENNVNETADDAEVSNPDETQNDEQKNTTFLNLLKILLTEAASGTKNNEVQELKKELDKLKEAELNEKLDNILSKLTFHPFIRSDWGENSEEKRVVKALQGLNDDDFKKIFKNENNINKIVDALYSKCRNSYDVINYILERLSNLEIDGNKLYYNRNLFTSNKFKIAKKDNMPSGFKVIDHKHPIGNNIFSMSITEDDFKNILKQFQELINKK